MKKYLIFYVLILMVSTGYSQTPANDPHWVIDEHWDFKTMNTTTLNQEWITNPCDKALDHKNGDVEPQSYQGGNVTISSAGLKLTAKVETVYDKVFCYLPNNHVLSDGVNNLRFSFFTSGFISSIDSLKYGYIESRMKVPYGYDFFPAFWTFKMSDAASNAAEIDIFEMVPAEDYPYNDDIMKTNAHLCYDPCWDVNRNWDITLPSSYTNYHTYAIAWSPTRIIWYVDNVEVRVAVNPGIADYTKTIINLALNPFVSNPGLTNYPQSIEIDYVKWYQLDMSTCSTVVNDCTFDFAGYQETVKKSITIGGSGCPNTQPSSSSIFLRATDFVQLNGEFTTPLGSELFIDVEACF